MMMCGPAAVVLYGRADDVLAIYTESTSKAGSFLQTDVAAAIKAHNNAVAGNSG
jgi:hypothetical protein